MAVSVKEVAQHAGVSLGTVSNVLNRPEVVAEATRNRVLAAIEELGFVRNESARQLRAGRSRTIGLVVLDVANPYFTDVARGVELLADETGTVVTLFNTGQDESRENRHLDVLEEMRVQGVLISPMDTANPRLERLAERGIPVVLVDRGARRRNRCSVAVDDVFGGRLAASHLLETGHRRVAFVGGPTSIDQVHDRLRGFRETVEDGGGEVTELPTSNLTVAEGARAAAAIAGTPVARRPTAVFCANDLLALGALQELTTSGVRVPQDVAIVGYDDIDFAAAAAVPLSSVRQPREQLGRAAAQLLMEEVGGGVHHHRQVVFEPELVVRASSAVAPTARRRRGTGGRKAPVEKPLPGSRLTGVTRLGTVPDTEEAG